MSQLYLNDLLCDVASIGNDPESMINYLMRVRRESLTNKEYNELIADAAEEIEWTPKSLRKYLNTAKFIMDNASSIVTPNCSKGIGKTGFLPESIRANGQFITVGRSING